MAMNSVSAECGICLECYDEHERKPLVLPCSHSFCKACLTKLETEDNRTCSHCRQEWTGMTLQDLLCCYQLIPSANTTPRQRNQLCTDHGADVLMWCDSCSKDICVKCLWLNHKSCNWLPMDEMLKVVAHNEFKNCVKEVAKMVSKNRETIVSLNHLISKLLTCQEEVKEWQQEAEQMLVLSSETEGISQLTVTVPDLQRKVKELKEVKTRSPAESLATVKALIPQRLRSSLNPEASPIVAIGIDLGMTDSCVGIIRYGQVNIIANEIGKRKTPNFVAFTDEEVLIGDSAKEIASFDAENTVFQILKVIGRRFSDPVVQEDIKNVPFKIFEDDGLPKIQVNYKGEVKVFTPVEISAMILRKLKSDAETYHGSRVTHAVISVPANFNNLQRQATREAAGMAGLNILDIIDEPIAAAIAYGVDKSGAGQRNVVVFDLTRNSLNVSVVSFSDGEFLVEAFASDSHIGGEEFSNCLVKYLLKEISLKLKTDLSSHQRALGRVKKSSLQTIEDLSKHSSQRILIECLLNGKDFRTCITRVRFEELCSDLFTRSIESVQSALVDSCLSKDDIHEVILTGDFSYIPKLQGLLQDFFIEAKLQRQINRNETVAYGTAMKAASLTL